MGAKKKPPLLVGALGLCHIHLAPVPHPWQHNLVTRAWLVVARYVDLWCGGQGMLAAIKLCGIFDSRMGGVWGSCRKVVATAASLTCMTSPIVSPCHAYLPVSAMTHYLVGGAVIAEALSETVGDRITITRSSLWPTRLSVHISAKPPSPAGRILSYFSQTAS